MIETTARPDSHGIRRVLLAVIIAALIATAAFQQWELGRHDQRIGAIASKVMTMDEQLAADHDRIQEKK